MLTPEQKEKIKHLMEITARSRMLIVSILLYFSWDMEQAMEFIFNAGDFLSEDLIPEGRRQAAEILLKEEELEKRQQTLKENFSIGYPIEQKINVLSQQPQTKVIKVSNNKAEEVAQKSTSNKRIKQIEVYLQQLKNQEWESEKSLQERRWFIKNSQNQELNDKLQIRMHKCFIGMKVNEGTGFFNCIYQLLFQNRQLVELILSMPNLINKEDLNSQYLNELHYQFGAFILSNNRYLKDSNIYEASNKLQNLKMEDNLINFAQQFENHLDLMNKCLSEINKKKQSSIFEQIFQSFGNKKQNAQKLLCARLDQHDRSLYFSLLKLKENVQQSKQQQPSRSYWAFEIKRKGLNHVDYWFTKKIDLDILFSLVKYEKIIENFEKNMENIKEIKQLQQIYNSLQIVASLQSEKDLIQIETLQSLNIEKETILKKLQNYFPFKMDLISKDDLQNSKYIYCLQATVIEIFEENAQVFYMYIYNFHEEQWYKIYDFQISIVSEELVFNDTRKNGCFLVYIHQSQIQNVKEFQQKISEIVSKIFTNQGDILQELVQIYPPLNGLNDSYIQKIQKSNREMLKAMNSELNNEIIY